MLYYFSMLTYFFKIYFQYNQINKKLLNNIFLDITYTFQKIS